MSEPNDPDPDALAESALALWDLPARARARLINVSENHTYAVDAGGPRPVAILRLHRPGYVSAAAIRSEHAWMSALDAAGAVRVCAPLPGRDGDTVQSLPTPGAALPRHAALFEFLDGVEPAPSADLSGPFHALGAIAARTHAHADGWPRPEGFERLVWDDAAVFGPGARWGDWRDGPGAGAPAARAVLERAETALRARLGAYGRAGGRYGLIHADMRLANILIHEGRPRLIDFDDCGFGWRMYDFAAAVSFMETAPDIPALKAAWVEGYRTERPLPPEDEAVIDAMVLLRRFALLAWIGGHGEVEIARELAPVYAEGSADLAERFLVAARA